MRTLTKVKLALKAALLILRTKGKLVLETALLILRSEGGDEMAVIYVALIIHGKRTFASVPAVVKEAVREILIDLEMEHLTE